MVVKGQTAATPDEDEEDEESMDWWTKYHASLDTMIEVGYLPVFYDLQQMPDIPHITC